METCKSMLNEFTAANQKNGIATLNAIYAPYNGESPAAPGRLGDPNSTLQYTHDSFVFTQIAMSRLLAMSNNRATMTKIPASGLLGKPPSAISILSTGTTANPTASAPNPPLLLDGWGSPIVFVPSSGLRGVATGSPATYSSGTLYRRGDVAIAPAQEKGPDGNLYTINEIFTWISNTPGSGVSPPASQWGGVCSPSLQPFFASSGPDGIFGFTEYTDSSGKVVIVPGGDDNLYSFEN